MMPHKDSAEAALRTIGALFRTGDIIEIRALNVRRTPKRPGSTHAGYFEFDNAEAIRNAVRELDGRSDGVYVTLNPVDRRLLARASNRLQAGLKHTTSDKNITEWRWLYIDCDPERPADISSTNEEHTAALDRAAAIRAFLSNRGWPEPIYCDSGNGAHLLYLLPPMDLEQGRKLVKGCLKALATRFSDALVKVDESTSNPARICKLYATMTRKGDDMWDRPHRRSQILEEPDQSQPVALEALEALANEVEAPKSAQSTQQNDSCSSRFRIDEWLVVAGLDIVNGPESYNNGRRWILRSCPFNPEHQQPAIIQLANGALVYRCLHNSCVANDWKAFRRHVCPDAPGGDQHVAGVPQEGGFTSVGQIPSVWTLESHCEWCVEDMIARGSVTLISAESGTGKTWLAYFLAGRVAYGRDVLGRAVKQCRDLDGENPLYLVKQRLLDLGISETPYLTAWGGWNTSPPAGPASRAVMDFAGEHRPLIIYDSLIEFHPGSEQSSSETRSFMRNFRALANMGATVLVLHHTGKADTAKQYRGSSDIKAAVDTAYLLERADEDAPELGKLTLRCFKSRLALARNFSMEFRRGLGFVAAETRSVREIINEVLREHPSSNQTQITTVCVARGCSKSQVEAALKNGNFDVRKGAKNAKLYTIRNHVTLAEESES